jgi:hypothetical protein
MHLKHYSENVSISFTRLPKGPWYKIYLSTLVPENIDVKGRYEIAHNPNMLLIHTLPYSDYTAR